MSTIHTRVSSRPRPHSHAVPLTGSPRTHCARTMTPHIHIHTCAHITGAARFTVPWAPSLSTFPLSQVTPTHAGTQVTHSPSHSRAPKRVPSVHPALWPLWPEAAPEWRSQEPGRESRSARGRVGRGAGDPVLGAPDRTAPPRRAPGDPRPLPPTVLSWAPMVAEKTVAVQFHTR